MIHEYKPLPVAPEKGVHGETYRNTSDFDNGDDHISITRNYSLKPLSAKWIWILHASFFIVNVTIFALACTVPGSTLQHVRQFSAWCKSC